MKKLIIIIAIGVIVLVGGGILALKFVTGSNNPKKEQPVVISLNKEILTNLAKEDSNMFHYIKVSVSLEVINNDTTKIIEAEMPKIRDEIISVFNGTKVNEFSTPTGIEQVKMRIVQRINLLLRANLVRKVLFTDMVVQ
ncbi:MAG: flagellar basal body-associated FliL family protein [bacterium]|nr:flagellar basal body-associated FliL family protein [bacterium]